MRTQQQTTIERPVEVVWEFIGVHHTENHPRWDPTLELWNDSGRPITAGTVLRRRTTRFGRTVDGTQEITEFTPMQALRTHTTDGDTEFDGFMEVRPDGDSTVLTIGLEADWLEPEMAATFSEMMKGSVDGIKRLIESET